jgi:hypothetical protein
MALPEYRDRTSTVEGKAKTLMRSAKQRATKHGRVFNITVEFVLGMLLAGVCPKTGLAYELSPSIGSNRHNLWGPSIDRKDSGLGYVNDNIQITCWAYNRAKGRMSDAEFLDFCRRVVDTAELTKEK